MRAQGRERAAKPRSGDGKGPACASRALLDQGPCPPPEPAGVSGASSLAGVGAEEGCGPGVGRRLSGPYATHAPRRSHRPGALGRGRRTNGPEVPEPPSAGPMTPFSRDAIRVYRRVCGAPARRPCAEEGRAAPAAQTPRSAVCPRSCFPKHPGRGGRSLPCGPGPLRGAPQARDHWPGPVRRESLRSVGRSLPTFGLERTLPAKGYIPRRRFARPEANARGKFLYMGQDRRL